MRSNYKKLGQFIQQVSIKNSDLRVDNLLGVSITKQFIPSIANIIGTDMTTYKIVKKGQFAYGPVTSRNGDKISVALLEDDEAIISTSYTAIEIIKTDELLPEYLMMWFRREEFDRYARYMSHGSTREVFGWDEMCDIELPVPSIEKQKEIVKEYHTIVDRIKLNEQLNQKLEDTAQSIYKEWFVNFEFPDENGKPYKSNGGEMVYCEELDMEIPKGWGACQIQNICEIGSSRRIFESEYVSSGVPFYRGKEISLKKEGKPITDLLCITEERYKEIQEKNVLPKRNDILLTAVGTIGVSYLVQNEKFYFKDGNLIWFKNFSSRYLNLYIYDFMQSQKFDDMISEITIGSTQSAITITTIGQQTIILPSNDTLKEYEALSYRLHKQEQIIKKENSMLYQLKGILLSKMATIER